MLSHQRDLERRERSEEWTRQWRNGSLAKITSGEFEFVAVDLGTEWIFVDEMPRRDIVGGQVLYFDLDALWRTLSGRYVVEVEGEVMLIRKDEATATAPSTLQEGSDS